MGDRHPHVGQRHAGVHRAVGEGHEAVDHRLRVHHHVEPVGRDAEQVMRLDQFEPLVHQAGRIDRHLRPHRPVRMGQRLASRVAAAIRSARPGAERAARGGQRHLLDRSRSARRRAPGRSRCARCRAAGRSRRLARPCRITGAPAQTSVSLLASATVRPAASAAWVGRTPTVPAMAAMTRSLGRSGRLDDRLRPGRGLDAARAERVLQGRDRRPDRRWRRTRARELDARSGPAPRRRARRRRAATAKRPGASASTWAVERPIDPVAPQDDRPIARRRCRVASHWPRGRLGAGGAFITMHDSSRPCVYQLNRPAPAAVDADPRDAEAAPRRRRRR